MMRGTVASLLALAIVARAPEVRAQPAGAPETALPQGVTPLSGERPMRFELTGGNSFVATRIGEDPEYFWVSAGGRLARVRKVEVARMGYDLEPPPLAPRRAAPIRPPSLLPLEQEQAERGDASSSPGRGLIVGGAVLFGIFYGGTLLFAPAADGHGELLVIPVFGPLAYGLSRGAGVEDLVGLTVVSGLQGLGALMVLLGVRQSSARRERGRHGASPSPALLAIVPELSPEHASLGLAGVF